ncbi:guanylate cyclase soluble subunit beta-2-like [Paramormyrops kingsleyae]|uniref:guanylate cyclase soluble subunit beta-2-like n=1 Tax=Paramormyrops kingsleyae TaxID=1676925 RepID=UPI000CD5E9A6|nr:guanylate cyclase soluble subunit beta-2-like [Paramormyrops kingsleyae]
MLPKHVANQLKEGKRVEAGEFKEWTILFSAVMTFTSIRSAWKPIQIVIMLNSMSLKLDRLTTVYDDYKVLEVFSFTVCPQRISTAKYDTGHSYSPSGCEWEMDQ